LQELKLFERQARYEYELSQRHILPSYDINKSTLIRDGMGIIQSLNAKRYNTFGELAKDYFDNMLHVFNTTVAWKCLRAYSPRNLTNPCLFSDVHKHFLHSGIDLLSIIWKTLPGFEDDRRTWQSRVILNVELVTLWKLIFIPSLSFEEL
jgi:hypothetical protein